VGGVAGRAVSPYARVGSMVLNQNQGGWASGGWISDSLIDGNVGSGTQQQWISRNSEWGMDGRQLEHGFRRHPQTAGR
jgi:hypothetical protein